MRSSLLTRLFVSLICISLLDQVGCSRSRYRLRADRDAHCILREKTANAPWRPPADFSVYPNPASRWHDPTPKDRPCLPVPAPQLYGYSLAEMPKRDPKRFQPERASQPEIRAPNNAVSSAAATPHSFAFPVISEQAIKPTADWAPQVLTVAYGESNTRSPDHSLMLAAADAVPGSNRLAVLTTDDSIVASDGLVDPAQQLTNALPEKGLETGENANLGADGTTDQDPNDVLEEEMIGEFGMGRVPIPAEYWDSIPANCLRRMLEFESVRDEYYDTFQRAPDPSQLDSAPRLALEDIIDQTSLNSRDLQSQKETLYRSALALTLDRFDYQLKPSAGGNGSALDFTHDKTGPLSFSTLGIPTDLAIDKMLCTGGDFLASFANNIILTFNGPNGFVSDVSSELLFDFSQSLLQYDVRLESLTQAERNVIYAARDYTRFRRELFVDLATEYYTRIQDFREVEIESQNYFTLVRQFNQGEAEFRAGLSSRIQLDQIEQQVIVGRRRLLERCNALDNALDALKIRIGLPTEEPLNLDLTELFLLTLRDELAVNGELIARVRSRLMNERQKEFPALATLLSAGAVLVERMRDSNELRNRLGEETPSSESLLDASLRLQTDAARLDVNEALLELQVELDSVTPSQPILFQRRMDVVNEQLEVVEMQLERVRGKEASDQISTLEARVEENRRQASQIGQRFELLISAGRLQDLSQLIEDSVQLERDLAALVDRLDGILDRDARQRTPEEQLQETITEVDELLLASEQYLQSTQTGLVPIEIDMDDAMMTALVRRFDLLNERGFLADDWRQIKFAADDLRSVLNLRATQSVRTRSRDNDAMDFTIDGNTTQLSLTFDAPFNRRAQRNAYRNTLINYQAALRRLALLEDNIKLSVRSDLRALALNREQYLNDIASAALAFERVVSTELELRLGIGSVAARDFLESQNAYTASLFGVASSHISFIRNRLELFLSLELLDVGDDGFWHQLYDDDVQPTADFQFPAYASPAYGSLHPCLKYSPEIRRMLCVPPGTARIHQSDSAPDQPSPTTDLEPDVPAEVSQPSEAVPLPAHDGM